MRLVKPVLLSAALIVLYLIVVRPLRAAVVRDWIYPSAVTVSMNESDFRIDSSPPRGLEIIASEGRAGSTTFSYSMAFGAYLFLPLVFFLFLRTDKSWSIFLLLFHTAFFIVETGLLFTGLSGSLVSLHAMDFLSYFLFPASFGIVGLAWFDRKGKRKSSSGSSAHAQCA